MLPTLRTRTAALSLSAVACAACFDGYPTEDAPLFEPNRMSQAERLSQLDHIGRSEQAQDNWQFALTPDCVLSAARKSRWSKAVDVTVPLRAATIRSSFNKASASYFVLANTPDIVVPVVLFETKRRFDAMNAEQLFHWVQRDCLAAQRAG